METEWKANNVTPPVTADWSPTSALWAAIVAELGAAHTLTTTAPTSTSLPFDTVGVTRVGPTPYCYASFGNWYAPPITSGGEFTLSGGYVNLWIDLFNQDDSATRIQMQVGIYKNGVLVASGVSGCMVLSSNQPPTVAELRPRIDVYVPSPVAFGVNDVLSMSLDAREGSDPSSPPSPPCTGGSHSSGRAKMYYDNLNLKSNFVPLIGGDGGDGGGVLD
jgi:hypothetical protein